MSISFNDLGLPRPLGDTLSRMGVVEPFPIQAATIPDALAGRDVSGKAPTGSGKTLAFGLPVLAKVDRAKPRRPRALILAPTRELAEQISSALQPIGKAVDRRVSAVYGGVGYGPQLKALRGGVDVLVATPGRLEDLIEQSAIDLADANLVVIDEADRMADMGFLPAVRRILDMTARKRQTMLYSATLDGEVARLSREYQTNPVRHEAGAVATTAADAEHHFWLIDSSERIDRTIEAIESSSRSIVFTRTRHGADRLAKQLERRGVRAVTMHGGRTQKQRSRALDAFTAGRANALIATDVAARGIHVDDVTMVIHFDPAQDSKDYVHRSGRTARAGAGGTVVSMVMPDQRKTVDRMQKELGMRVPVGPPNHTGTQTRPKASHPVETIYVGNLPWKTTDRDLHRLFSRHGEVMNVTVASKGGRSKGYGFVEMAKHHAPAAIHAMAGTEISGRRLQVRPAR